MVVAGMAGCDPGGASGGGLGSSSSSSGFCDGRNAYAVPTLAMGAAESAPTAAQRAVAEADIIQLDGGRLYAMSGSGTVSVVNVADPKNLSLLGTTTISGKPFEMYLRGTSLVVMSNAAVTGDGAVVQKVVDPAAATTTTTDDTAGALVTTLDVRDPAQMAELSTLKVPGEIADSRTVGDVLYLATYENATCFGCGAKPRTMVTTFNVADPNAVHQVDQASFQSNAPDSQNLAWGMAWKRSIVATSTRLYIGGHADLDPNTYTDTTSPGNEGIVDVLDITDPTGKLAAGARLRLPGAVLSRWQLDETDGILRVISQPGAGRTGNGTDAPSVDTFRIDSTSSFTPLGHTTLTLPMQEGLRTVRFDATRAYAITFNQTDPLFAIDLTDPANPVQRGELKMPGWMFYLEPHGNRVVGLGVDRTDPDGSLNVSLFDVSNMAAPVMLKRIAFGAKDMGEDYAILDYEVPEDQDRIQKAFRVFDDGLIAVPFSSTSAAESDGTTADACDNPASGIQLVDWAGDTLVKRALLPVAGNPRRSFEKTGSLIAVSDSNVRSFSLTDHDVASQASDLVIGTCVAKSMPPYMGGDFMGGLPVGGGCR